MVTMDSQLLLAKAKENENEQATTKAMVATT